MQQNVKRPGKAALRQGLLFGLSLGVLFIICNMILAFASSGTFLAGGIYTSTPTSTGNGALFSTGGLLVPILVYLVAGLRASQQTGRVATGTLAGLWTGLFSAGITWVYTIVFSALFSQNSESGELFAILTPIVGIFGIVLAVVLGTGIGALGGLIGKRRASPPTQFSQQSMFSPAPTSPQNRQ